MSACSRRSPVRRGGWEPRSCLAVECANALWLRVRRRTLPPTDAERQLVRLRRLTRGLDLRPLDQLLLAAWRIAAGGGITVYDACYVALAEMQGVPLVTAQTGGSCAAVRLSRVA